MIAPEMANQCKHEMDPDSIKYHKKGRIGICKYCGCKLRRSIFVSLKRERPHMSKKKRLKLRREKDGKKIKEENR